MYTLPAPARSRRTTGSAPAAPASPRAAAEVHAEVFNDSHDNDNNDDYSNNIINSSSSNDHNKTTTTTTTTNNNNLNNNNNSNTNNMCACGTVLSGERHARQPEVPKELKIVRYCSTPRT